MKDYIQIGIEKGLISLNEDRSWITYGYQKKERKVFLHMGCVRDTAMLYFGGSAGQQRVPASYLENFDLPLPPKEKQMENSSAYQSIAPEGKDFAGRRQARS